MLKRASAASQRRKKRYVLYVCGVVVLLVWFFVPGGDEAKNMVAAIVSEHAPTAPGSSRPAPAPIADAAADASPAAHLPPAASRGPGMLYGWGFRVARGTTKLLSKLVDDERMLFTAVASGGHNLAIDRHGQLYSWGRNDSAGGGGHGSPAIRDAGQLGRGGGPSSVLDVLPVDLGGHRAVAIAAGRYHSAAVTEGGDVLTWGLDDFGQLGRPTAGHDGAPRPVAVPPALSVTAGRYHTTVVTRSGELWTFGLNLCGSPEARSFAAKPSLPVRVGRASSFVLADAGYSHILALDSTGAVHACATGDDGYAGSLVAGNLGKPHLDGGCRVLGRGGALLDLLPVPLAEPVVAVAAGRCHSLAAGRSGALYVWGEASGHTPSVLAIAGGGGGGGSRIVAVDAGEYMSVALSDAGELWTWGASAELIGRPGEAVRPATVALAGGLRAVAIAAGYQTGLALVRDSQSRPVGPPYVHTRLSLPFSQSVVDVDPETVAGLPKDGQYLADYLSPCWHTDGRVRCLPYFQILGVSKCGTTNLFGLLIHHGDMSPAANKGPHWWDERVPKGPEGRFTDYVALYDRDAADRLPGNPELVFGEASSNTFTAGAGAMVRSLRKYPLTLAAYLHAILPDQKNIVILREPVSRFISAYYYYNHKEASEAGLYNFAADLLRETARCVEVSSLFQCSVSRYDHLQQLLKGAYALYLPTWFSVYPREAFLFLRLEALKADARGVLKSVFRFLSMREPNSGEWERMLTAPVRNQRRTGVPDTTIETMRAEPRAALVDFYRPLNAELARLLGDTSFDYNSMYEQFTA